MNAPGRGVAVVPARNEASSIPETLARIDAAVPGLDVVVVDDGSTDGTGLAAAAAGARVLTHPFWLGYGAALQTGFKFALAHGYDWVVTIDADGQHDARDIPVLVSAVTEGAADISVGSRFLADPAFAIDPLRRAGILFFRGVYRVLTRRVITDPTSGYKCLARAAVAFCARDVFPHDYPDTDMMITLQKARFRIVERPVRMHPRRTGRSMHAGIGHRIYYVFKVCVSILATVFRESHAHLGEPDPFRNPGARGPESGARNPESGSPFREASR